MERRSISIIGDLKSEAELGNVPTDSKRAATVIPECEMDALLLGNIGELVSLTPNERNWRGICISLLVIIAVLGMILFFIVLLSPPYDGPLSSGAKFTIDDVTGSDFKVIPFNGTWISNTELVYPDEYRGVSMLCVSNGTVRTLIEKSRLAITDAVDFKLSADRNYILIISKIQKVFTNQHKALYHIQDLKTRKTVKVDIKWTERKSYNVDEPYMQEAEWSPVDNGLVFVHQNDIYYKPEAMPDKFLVHRLTYTGSDTVYNGITDWMYQEEILKTGKAFWFSPDGKYLAYAVFNDSDVVKEEFILFNDFYHPQVASRRYPQVGEKNPKVTVKVVDLDNVGSNRSHVSLSKPEMDSADSEPYFINLIWGDKDEIAVIWLNRAQNVFVISVCFKPVWTCQDAHIQKSVGISSWVEPNHEILFSDDGLRFLTILSVSDGTINRFPQVCHVDINTHVVTPLTQGKFTVTSLRAWDYVNHVVYFEAAPQENPAQRHLYNVSDDAYMTNKWTCLTCPKSDYSNVTINYVYRTENFTTDYNNSTNSMNMSLRSLNNGTRFIQTEACLFVKSYFPKMQPMFYYVLECLGPEVPKTVIMDVESNLPVYLLNNRTELRRRYSLMAKPQRKLMQIEMDKGFQAQVRLFLPPIARDRLEMEFPFIVFVGGSPGAQSVTEEWSVDWNTYLVSSLNFIVAVIDAKGSASQSDNLKFAISKGLGTIAVEDQLAILLYLRESVRHVDRNRIGVWGKGYGGFITAKILEEDENNNVHCAISLAPVTSYKKYLSVWTERYMSMYNKSASNRHYDEADLTERASNFRNKKFFIIHGTADRKVPLKHTMWFSRALIEANVLFRQFVYPDEDHDFATTQKHLLMEMETFWNDCFGAIEYEQYEEGLNFFNFGQSLENRR